MNPAGRSSTVTVRAAALIALVLVGTAVGGWRAASMAAAKPAASVLLVNDGSYQVTHAEQVLGLSSSDLAGMSHGISGLVTDDKALIKVTLVVSAGDSPVSYDTGVLRLVTTGSSGSVSPVGGTLAPGRLRAHARIEGSVSFIVPRNGAQLGLRALGDPRVVPLLQVDKAPAGAGSHKHPPLTPSKRGPSAARHQ